MRLATIRVGDTTRAVRLDDDAAIELGAADLVEVLRRPDWRASAREADGPSHPLDTLDYAPLVLAPEKIFCVGLNYRGHILEMGRTLPEHPTLFAKFSRALIGAYDDIVLPAASQEMDWEAELAVVIGAPIRNASPDEARAAIGGYTVLNDVTARDWQYRTLQWLQGKTFEATTPIGPWLVTDDTGDTGDTGDGASAGSAELSCELDDETVQRADGSASSSTASRRAGRPATSIRSTPSTVGTCTTSCWGRCGNDSGRTRCCWTADASASNRTRTPRPSTSAPAAATPSCLPSAPGW